MSSQRSLHRSAIPSSFYKMVVFTTTTVLLIGLLGTLIGNISFVSSRSYYGLFTDATGVNKGDRVRLAGVEVGVVKGVEIVPDGDHRIARLEFTVEDDVPVYQAAQLELRYENIVGQRYLAIEETPGDGAKMAEGATFPTSQTSPALSLTELFNGFQPLFRALEPERLNTFSYELVRALQGESRTLQALMRDTAQLTNTIADRDEVIGSVVGNLNAVLETVGTRDTKLTQLIVQFRNLMAGLAGDSEVIDASLPSLAALLDGTASLVTDIRAPLKSNISSLRVLAGQLYDTRDVLDKSLKGTPFKLRTLARTGSYGSWFNFYVCGLQINLTMLDGTVSLGGPTLAANEKDTVCGAGGVQ
jgi:phospholipid/cholesterol/gamma-HCH transport system substrate-binding protein